MPTRTIGAFLLMGAVLAIGSLMMRIRSGGKIEIKPIDLAFLIIPLLLLGIATGKLKGIDLFGVKADFSDLWAQAAKTRIEGQVKSADVATVRDAVHPTVTAIKGGVNELDQLTRRKVEALEFHLGGGGYYGPAIQQYLDALSGNSYLRVLVLSERGGKLFGVFNASDLIGHLRVTQGYGQFEQLLNQGGDSERAGLAQLPGFVSVNDAVTTATSKRDALAGMERLDMDLSPVVDGERHYVGLVERSKLTASLILAVSDKLIDAKE